jgi:hypothetical protein
MTNTTVSEILVRSGPSEINWHNSCPVTGKQSFLYFLRFTILILLVSEKNVLEDVHDQYNSYRITCL